MFAPFNATVELAVNPVPNSVTTAAVFTGPEFGEICVSVGAGGFVIDTVSAFEMPPFCYGRYLNRRPPHRTTRLNRD